MTPPDQITTTSPPAVRRRWPIILGAAVALALVAGAAGAYFLLRGPDTFTASGSVTVKTFTKDKTCASVDGFSEGMKVVVTDPAGTIVGLGALSAPTPTADPSAIAFDGVNVKLGDTLCQFQFRVANVPAKKVSYGVAIGEHRPYQATEAELRSSLKLAPTS